MSCCALRDYSRSHVGWNPDWPRRVRSRGRRLNHVQITPAVLTTMSQHLLFMPDQGWVPKSDGQPASESPTLIPAPEEVHSPLCICCNFFFCDLPRCWLATCLPATAAAIAVHTAALQNGRLASLQRTLDEVRAAVLDAMMARALRMSHDNPKSF